MNPDSAIRAYKGIASGMKHPEFEDVGIVVVAETHEQLEMIFKLLHPADDFKADRCQKAIVVAAEHLEDQ